MSNKNQVGVSPVKSKTVGQVNLKERGLQLLCIVLFLAALAHYLWAVSVGWTHTITEHHDFRQTQCAITAYYMVKEPFKLAYETPVFGLPWSIPMEFPLYQWVVASVVRVLSTNLEQTGRFVGVCFYLLTLIPAYFLLASFRVAPRHRLVVLSLLLVSPFYTFWSRSFMIETTALFFGVSYLACAVRSLDRHSRWATVLATVFGVLVALVKVTTFPPFAAAIGLYALREHLKFPFQWPGNRTALRHGLRLLILVGIPLAAAIAWTRYADFVKLQNALGYLNTSSVLAAWNYGTLEQKLSGDTWIQILGRIPTLFSTDEVFWLLCVVAFALVLPLTRRRWKEVLVCIGLFFVAPICFTNLHFVHDYYMCANGIFLLAAAGFVFVGVLETPGWQNAGSAMIALVLLTGVYGHQTMYVPAQNINRTDFLPLAFKIRDMTPPDAINIYVGFHWKPLLPYYSERRALMIPGEHLTDGTVRTALLALRGQKIGIVLTTPSGSYPTDRVLEYMKEFGLTAQGVYTLPQAP